MEYCSLRKSGYGICLSGRQIGPQSPVKTRPASQTPGDALERFQSSCAVLRFVKGGIFLRKMPLGSVLSGYCNSGTAVRRRAPAPPASSRLRAARSAISAVAVLALLVLSSASLRAQSANTDYKHGQRAEALQDYDTAYQDYQLANKKDPTNLSFQTALDRVRLTDADMHITTGRQLLQSGNTQGALVEFLHAAEIDPADEEAQQEIGKIRQMEGTPPPPTPGAGLPEATGEQAELNSIGAPVQLQPLSNEPLSLHMTEDAKVIYQAVGKAAGVNVLFDPDYSSKRIQVDLNNVSLLDALRIVSEISGTFWRPVTSNTIFVAQDTRVKRTEMEEQAVQTFYLTNAWQQNDLNDIQTALRNVLPNARVYGVASQNAIVMRGTPDELLLAQKLINDLDKPQPEVVVDVGILEVSRNWERNLGINWPSSVGVALQPPTSSTSSTSSTTSTTGTTSASTTLYDLAHLKATDFAVNVGSAQLNLLLNNTNTQILADPRIRATDGQKATLTIGSRIPIATGSYSAPGITAAATIGYAQTQFTYIDVGIKLEVTPTIHYDDDVTLKIHVEDEAESGNTTIEGVTEPIISQRIADQVIRLRDGQASILGGIVNNQETLNWTGIPGLSSIPFLKYLFGSNDHQIQNDDLVFVVIPHVVRSEELNQQNLRAVDTGEGQSINLRFVQHPAPAAPAVRPVAMQQPGPQTEPQPQSQPQSQLGSVPAVSAPSAASAALTQLRATAQTGQTQPPPAPQPSASSSPPALPPQPQAAPAPQAQSATPPHAQATPPSPPPSGAPQAQAAQPGPPSTPSGAQAMSFQFNVPGGPLAADATFQVPIVLNGGEDIASVLLQLRYDPAHLTLIDVSTGNFLNRGGQAVPLIHRDDGPGNVMVVAALPQGTAGVSGAGTLCVLTFRAKAPGVSALIMTHTGVLNSQHQPLPAQAAQANITVK